MRSFVVHSAAFSWWERSGGACAGVQMPAASVERTPADVGRMPFAPFYSRVPSGSLSGGRFPPRDVDSDITMGSQ